MIVQESDEATLPEADGLRSKRSDRRAHLQRMRRRAEEVARSFGIPAAARWVWARKNANHLKMCSCWMCGHKRASEGPSVSELRQILRENDTE